MEKTEEDTLMDNLSELVSLTECTTSFLTMFVQKKILSMEDVDAVNTKQNKSERVFKFYQLIITRANAYPLLLHALWVTGQSGALKLLQKGISRGPKSSDEAVVRYTPIETIIRKSQQQRHSVDGTEITSVDFGVRPPSILFTGREEELQSLHKIISSAQGNMTVISQITSVCGLGGIGKTQLARRYVQVYRPYFDNNVVWIDAASEETLNRSFRQFASDVLDISTTNADNKDRDVALIVHDCYQHFSHSKCLFVFDNAEMGNYLKPYLPNNIRISVLITSRNCEWGEGVRLLDLKVLKDKEATSFVINGLHIGEDENIEEVQLLINKLQCFPLALQQAISYIKNERVTGTFPISQYLHELNLEKKGVLDIDISGGLYDGYSKTTFNTWKMTMDKIASLECGNIAYDLLELISYLGPETIPRQTLFHKEICTEEQLKFAIRLLCKYSLVDGYENQSLLSIHRLVQHVVRIWTRTQAKDSIVLKKALKLFESDFDERSISHAIWVWKYAVNFEDLVIGHSKFPAIIIRKLRDLRWLEEGIKFAKEVMPVLQNKLDINSIHLINFEEDVADVFRLNNDFEEALKLLWPIYSRKINMFGEFSEEALWTKQKIGLTLFNRGSYTEGFEFCNSASQGLEKILGNNNRKSLEALSRTTRMACKVGEVEIAKTRVQKVLENQQRAFGENDIDVYHTKMRLGIIQADMGSITGLQVLKSLYSELSSITEQTSEIEEFSHLVLIKVCDQLYRFKFYKEGLEKSQTLYEIRRKRFGGNHIYTINASDVVGLCLLGLGRIDEAYSVLARIYIKLKERWGTYHNYTLRVLSNIGLALSRQGKHRQAKSAFDKVFEGLKKYIDSDCIDMLEIKFKYAEALYNSGSWKKALGVLREVKEIHRKKFGIKQVLYRQCIELIKRVEQNVST